MIAADKDSSGKYRATFRHRINGPLAAAAFVITIVIAASSNLFAHGSPGHVAEEIALAKRYFPQVREFFFDDDTFTDDLPRAEAIARLFVESMA